MAELDMALGVVTGGHNHNDTVNVTKKRAAIAPRGLRPETFVILPLGSQKSLVPVRQQLHHFSC